MGSVMSSRKAQRHTRYILQLPQHVRVHTSPGPEPMQVQHGVTNVCCFGCDTSTALTMPDASSCNSCLLMRRRYSLYALSACLNPV